MGIVGTTAKWRPRFLWSRTNVAAFDILRSVVGFLLLVAALLKAHQLISEPPVPGGILDNRRFQAFLIEVEFIFGVWLEYGLYSKVTRVMAIGLFATFSCYSLLSIVIGRDSCNCFGYLSFSPWLALTLDTVILAAFLLIRPADVQEGGVKQILGFCATAFLFTVPAGMMLRHTSWSMMTANGEFDESSRSVVLNPVQWINRRLPLLAHIDIGDDIATGEWTIVLYRHDCPKCEAVLEELANGTNERHFGNVNSSVAFVELPPYGKASMTVLPKSIRYGRMSDRHKWFVETPLILSIRNGVVAGTTTSSGAP